jgi:hypothetical protein
MCRRFLLHLNVSMSLSLVYDLGVIRSTGHQTEHVAASDNQYAIFFAKFCRNDKSIRPYQWTRAGDMTNFVCRPNRKQNVTGNGALCVCSNSGIDKILIKTDIK